MNTNDPKLTCKICNKTFTRYCSTASHVKRTHGLDAKTYYDKYFKTPSEGFCKKCDKPVDFRDLQNGYREFCSRTCFWQVTTQSEEVKEKRKKTCLEKYGTESFMSTDKFKKMTKETCLERYGMTNFGGTPESIAKIKATKLERYGDAGYNNQVKMRETKSAKYGNEWYSNREQALKTLEKKYDVPYHITSPYAVQQIRDKIVQDWNESHDEHVTTSPLQSPSIRNKALSHTSSMTRPEKKLNEFLTNRKFQFQYCYECNGKNFDFAIFKNGRLNILIEIDGLYFHGLVEDSNGKHVRGDTDYERFSKVPEGVKFIVCDENKLEDCFKEILKVFDVDYDIWVQSIVDNMPKEFPYPEYSVKRMQTDWNHLQNWTYNGLSNVGNSIVKNYHKSIWTAHVGKSLSPVECWNDKKLLEKTIKNRIIYSSTLSSQSIAAGFDICKTAPKVSVFRPILAKHLIETYLNDCQEIFDPFSGFSGRMLGTCALGKKYIGQDINTIHVQESNEIIKDFNLNASVACKDVFESSGKYESLFTCSPYRLKEVWNETEIDKSCDEWIDECLKRFNCHAYLFVVDKTEKYKDNIVEIVKNKSHFGCNEEYVICLTK